MNTKRFTPDLKNVILTMKITYKIKKTKQEEEKKDKKNLKSSNF
ncbi:hypothetical protein LCGC14_1433000 [marine sediment metagenome]|uniref:Uncharacterized protein n=1 Tax=marine sediment metagenome TaxID=412755 RepID=A0A0F9M3H4_9ZZZZ